jgi:hypothetical protein
MSHLHWHVGMKVVCVDAKGSGGCLRKGEVYTIGCLEPEFVGLEEPSTWSDEHGSEPCWLYTRFRPVHLRKTDISVFTAMLNKDKVPA